MPNEKITLLDRIVHDSAPVVSYLWFVVLALWGGTAKYLATVASDESRKVKITELLIAWSISGFSGLLAAFLCAELELSYYLTAVAAGIAGHMGGRALEWIELVMKSRLPTGGKN